MKRCSIISNIKTLSGLLFCGAFIIGCSSSNSGPEPASGDTSVLSDQTLDASQASLASAVSRISEVIVDRSNVVLRNLNEQISGSGVPESLAGCISSTEFPVLEYYCGSEGQGVRLTELGYPLHEFRFTEDTACVSGLLSDQDATECTLEAAEAELDQDWYVRYRFVSEQDNEGVTTIQVSSGFLSSINDPSFATDVCVVTLLGSEIVSYNDVIYCDSVLRDVAGIAETSF